MFISSRHYVKGSAILVAMLAVAICAAVLAAYYEAVVSRSRSVYHGADWHEALHAAEGGIDYVVQQLNKSAATGAAPDSYTWTGWTLDSTYPLNGVRALSSPLPLGGNENVTVSSLTVDVYTRDTSASTPSYDPWFRVRSTARANLPGRVAAFDKRDEELRRMALGAMKGSIPDPHVSRTVEAIIKPQYRFPFAIETAKGLTLGNSANWLVDSFDSSSTSKSDTGVTGGGVSAGGIYPSAHPAKIQSNGNIATMNTEPDGVAYGPLISGNGAVVKGSVGTNGGDDPSTTTHENVSGSTGMDQSRIYSNFNQTMTPVSAPTWTSFLPAPSGNTNFVTSSSASSPSRYVVNGNVGAFVVTAPASGAGYVQILINGDLSIGNGNKAQIVIPPNVYATIYVNGNIDFGNGTVNSDSSSSQVATHLVVYGVASSGTYNASGNGTDVLAFYGPNYDMTVKGTVTTIGSMVGKSFTVSGGGNGGFHYDEALGHGGSISGWAVASYFEDSRQDPQ